MIAILIPIILILVVGTVLVTFYYLRSRERQLLIEKGLDAESIKEFFNYRRSEKSSYNLMKIGIIAVAFGLGLGLGLGLARHGQNEFLIPLCIFVFTGAGFIFANVIGKKLDDKEKD